MFVNLFQCQPTVFQGPTSRSKQFFVFLHAWTYHDTYLHTLHFIQCLGPGATLLSYV